MKVQVTDKFLGKEKAIINLIDSFFKQGDILVQGARNIIKVFDFEEYCITLKYFKKLSFFKSLIYTFFRDSKAKRSFEYANYLLENNISTPLPIAYIECKNKFNLLTDSFYACEHIAYDFTIRELIHDPLFENRTLILQQFTTFTFNMHQANVHFLDHSPGNTLIKNIGPEQYEFYLIDLNRMKFESLTIEQRMDNFKKMWLSKTMVKIIAKQYAKLSGQDEHYLEKLLIDSSTSFKRKITKKKWLKRKLKNIKT